ncbi:MAG: adenosylcobinamide-GDP ribazoletransferase [Oscillospiraceae bacterium]|nr:adenosylcobinamide-GDP ribazoletransferase [Oscillospiraceae bacterium]
MLKSFASAFLMYSRIPMPAVEWKEENRRYALCFFPLIGAVIGGMFLLWRYVCGLLGIGSLLTGVVSAAIPVIVTGGIHLDGFCDVVDAKASFADNAKKLEIMSDPHIGSFAVINLAVYLLLQTAVMCEISSIGTAAVTALGFILSRALSGIGAVCFKSAKSDGALQSFIRPAHKKITLSVLILMAVTVCTAMATVSLFSGISAVLSALCCFVYYRRSSYKNFGGITGDTAGWFLQITELAIPIMALVGEKFAEVLTL